MKRYISQYLPLAIALIFGFQSYGAEGLNERIKDTHYSLDSFWIYNDFETARKIAQKHNKPLFITFRCVPCHNCKAFDAEVAHGSKEVAELAKREFVSVRLVEMKGVDLSQFQFDYDLNWAAMFINPDGTVYARYGTQSAEGPDAYNSIEGLVTTMRKVAEAHKNYPNNKSGFIAKKGKPVAHSNPLELPGLNNRYKYANQTELSNCIHCHNIHDAIHNDLYESGKLTKDKLWKYPLPDNIGIEIDAVYGNKVKGIKEGSPASSAGVKAGDIIHSIQGQSILSIADMQWILHGLSNNSEIINIVLDQDGESREVELKTTSGWKESDISWRASMWNLPPRLGMWTPLADPKALKESGLSKDQESIFFKWINRKMETANAAWEAGLRTGDVLTKVNGKKANFKPNEFHSYIKLNYKPGDTIHLEVLRKGEVKNITFKLFK